MSRERVVAIEAERHMKICACLAESMNAVAHAPTVSCLVTADQNYANTCFRFQLSINHMLKSQLAVNGYFLCICMKLSSINIARHVFYLDEIFFEARRI